METPTTLRDAILWFADFEHCRQFMVELRWADGVVKCPRCNSEKVTWLANARVWKCYAKHERPTFTLKTGTIFEDSPVPLEKWLLCRVDADRLQERNSVPTKSPVTWESPRKARGLCSTGFGLAMQDSFTGGKLSGEVEVDETFIGGKARNMHGDVKARKIQGRRGPEGKAIVAAVLERGGKVRARVIEKRRKTAASIAGT